jgi:hypothetical protein
VTTTRTEALGVAAHPLIRAAVAVALDRSRAAAVVVDFRLAAGDLDREQLIQRAAELLHAHSPSATLAEAEAAIRVDLRRLDAFAAPVQIGGQA